MTVIAPTCFLQAWLEGRSLDQRSILVSQPGSRDASGSLVLGAELQPGLYRLRVWTACTTVQGVATTSELLLKALSEVNLRPVTGNDLLHREGEISCLCMCGAWPPMLSTDKVFHTVDSLSSSCSLFASCKRLNLK